MYRVLRTCATMLATMALAFALALGMTPAHAADERPAKAPHTVTVGVTGSTWGNGPYVGVRFSRPKTEYLYNGVIGESVFAGVGVLCGTLTRAPYGWAFAATCAVVMTARYTQVKNALAQAHNDKKCFEARHFPVGYNPFTNPFKSMTCKWSE